MVPMVIRLIIHHRNAYNLRDTGIVPLEVDFVRRDSDTQLDFVRCGSETLARPRGVVNPTAPGHTSRARVRPQESPGGACAVRAEGAMALRGPSQRGDPVAVFENAELPLALKARTRVGIRGVLVQPP